MSEARAPAPPPVPPPPPQGDPIPPAPPPVVEELPRRFGKYTLIRKLAVGGMAELFLALQRSMAGFEKLVVVKRVLPKLVQDTGFIEMLLDEARIAATLNHPNVAHIYDVGVHDGEYFIAMEHIHGEDLRSIVRQMKKENVTSFPLEHALAIVLGCCKGLVYAHDKRDLDGEQMNIVHRDVSPQNILVTFSGDVKLVDFGIAKAGRSKEEDTKSGQLKGKVPYMSPEQAQGFELDRRSDIFSLGVILFELCTGRRLFRGPNEMETLKRIVEGTYPAPRALNPNLSPRLESIIQRALAKDTSERYQSAQHLQADLEGFIRDEQLAVTSISLGNWMQTLFKDKLTQQKQMLAEGRQLAEVIAAQAAEEESMAGASGVRPKPASKVPLVLALLAVLIAGAGVAAFFLLRPDPPPPIPVGPGVIAITSDPPGAAIWLDGARQSERTPSTFSELPVATYSVKLTLDGYEEHVEDVVITEQEPSRAVSATLQRETASSFAVINIRSTPSGARILFDGRDTGKVTPDTIDQITAGEEHTLALSLEYYVTKTETLTLDRGQVRDLRYQLEATPLEPDEAIIRIVTVPDDARVQVDGGEWSEDGSPYEYRVEADPRFRVAVARAGYRDHDQRVRLPGGETTEITVTLQRLPEQTTATPMGAGGPPPMMEDPAPTGGPGTLTFDARPWCNVTVAGRNLGQTPVVNASLPAGNHTLVCVNPELGARRSIRVTINPGETTRRVLNLSE